MDKLSSFVEGLVSHLGKSFFLAGFIPALALVAANQYVIFSPDYSSAKGVWNFFPSLTTPWLNLFTGEMLTTIVLALIIGLVLVVLNSVIVRMFEGLVPGVRQILFPFYLRNLRRYRDHYASIEVLHEKRQKMLAQKEEDGEFDENAAYALFDELHKLHGDLEKAEPVQQLPYLRNRVAPTAFGNVWAIMEEYPLRRYGMDGMLFWPYVREVISQKNERLLDEIDNQKLIIDVLVNLALVMGILTIEGSVFAVLRFQWQMLALAIVSFILFLILYQSAVSNSRSLASLVTKGYDLYRLPVLDAFDIERPASLDDEYWAWTRLAAFLRRGESFYFEMLDRRDGAGSDGGA